jgi:hypothetical protein
MIDAFPMTTNGNTRKQAAHTRLEAQRERYVRLGRRAFLVHLIEHGSATADDTRAVIELPDGINPKLFGAVPGPLARAGIIRRVAFTTTTRAVAHARPVSVWALADEAKAHAWLVENPAPLITVTREQQLLPILMEGRADV